MSPHQSFNEEGPDQIDPNQRCPAGVSWSRCELCAIYQERSSAVLSPDVLIIRLYVRPHYPKFTRGAFGNGGGEHGKPSLLWGASRGSKIWRELRLRPCDRDFIHCQPFDTLGDHPRHLGLAVCDLLRAVWAIAGAPSREAQAETGNHTAPSTWLRCKVAIWFRREDALGPSA
jgi:hypothetical protein